MSPEPIAVVQSVPLWLPQTETWLYDQVRFLPETVESHIVCEATQHLDQFALPRIHCLRRGPRYRWVGDLALRKLGARRHLGFLAAHVRRTGARVLHSHFGNTGWADMGAVRDRDVAHVVTFYGLDVNYFPTIDPRWRPRYRDLFARVTRVLCEGEHMARSVVELGCPGEKVRVHRLGVDVDAIAFRPRTWRPDEPLRFFIAASFREKKGIPYAIDALGMLQRELDLEVTIVGDAHGTAASRREKAKILDAIARHGLGAKTRLLGYIPFEAMRREALEHHVFLAPSVTAADGDTEGGAPVSIIEMCASGMPVVSTRHCDIPGVIVDGETGRLADERDVGGLVDAIRWLASNPDRWDGMLAAARRRVEAEFNARLQGERLAEIYHEVAAPGGAGDGS